MYNAIKIIVTGKVQGVGFRPFVYSLAKKHDIKGIVQNNNDRVTIIAEGKDEALKQMLKELKTSPPLLSEIDDIQTNRVQPSYYHDFTIIASESNGNHLPLISSDAAICKDCLTELLDPSNRRFRYPFTNCTQCGPRYTITKKLPYDRPNTTMNNFEMCPKCKEEYNNPLDKRYHAQPICCPRCGPTLSLLNSKNKTLGTNFEALAISNELLKQGKVIAIKGIGGYHLACDAYQENAVNQLRLFKKRPQRPLAVMVKSLAVARKMCNMTEKEEKLLKSFKSPIVVLSKRNDCSLPENVAPGMSTIGIMLPYTPLHYLLFEQGLECLIMTSANISGQPIYYHDDMIHQLFEISDYVLTHNRDIYLPLDDTVVQSDGENVSLLRRSRGFVPDVIKVPYEVSDILALGGNQKNTFAIGKGNQIIVSHHIGDLNTEEMIQSFQKNLQHYKEWLGVQGKYIVSDKHPSYETTILANQLGGKIFSVQHHHAHLVSCMVENGINEPCLGIILDGTGYGDDGQIWGFEFLYGDTKHFQRLAHLDYTPLPGGEKAIKEPWRNAVGMLIHYWKEEGKELSIKLFPEKVEQIHIIDHMLKKKINSPLAGTCGRLFDAVSAILGICTSSTYEGEAAVKLANYLYKFHIDTSAETYPFSIDLINKQQLLINFSPMIKQITHDKLSDKPISKIVQTFHQTIALCCVEVIRNLYETRPELNKKVVLSGGSFQNIYLTREIRKILQNKGFSVYTHTKVPCNDGGLPLGQLAIAASNIHR